jgi:hypothetical protein
MQKNTLPKLMKDTILKKLFVNSNMGYKSTMNFENLQIESGSDAFAADVAKACPLEGGFGLQIGQEPVCPNYKLIQSLSTEAM